MILKLDFTCNFEVIKIGLCASKKVRQFASLWQEWQNDQITSEKLWKDRCTFSYLQSKHPLVKIKLRLTLQMCGSASKCANANLRDIDRPFNAPSFIFLASFMFVRKHFLYPYRDLKPSCHTARILSRLVFMDSYTAAFFVLLFSLVRIFVREELQFCEARSFCPTRLPIEEM